MIQVPAVGTPQISPLLEIWFFLTLFISGLTVPKALLRLPLILSPSTLLTEPPPEPRRLGSRRFSIKYGLKAFASGTKAIFEGAAASGGNQGLWITDGTTGGTQLVTASVNMAQNNDGTEDAALNSTTAVFVDTNSQLWVTDGTAAGTSKINVTFSTSQNPFANFPESTGLLTSLSGQV